jgi:predicted PurR-regulated permease PerM
VNRQWLGTAFFFALLLLILYCAFLILTPFLKAIAWAVILAILVYPVYAWLLRLLRWQATPAALIVIVAITLLVIVPGIELGWFLTDEAITLVQTVRSLMSDDGLAHWAETPWVQSIMSYPSV